MTGLTRTRKDAALGRRVKEVHEAQVLEISSGTLTDGAVKQNVLGSSLRIITAPYRVSTKPGSLTEFGLMI